MASDNDQERSLPASERRIEQARAEGQIARSRELVTASIALVSVGVFWWGGQGMLEQGKAVLREGLRFDAKKVFDPAHMLTLMGDQLLHAGLALLPLFVGVIAAVLLGSLAIGGWNFSTDSLAPRFDRLSLSSGLARMFSLNSLSELLKAVMKTLLLGGVAVWMIWRSRDSLIGLLGQSSQASLVSFGELALFDFMVMVGGLVLIAGLDVPFQLWNYLQQLKMSPEELRREMKESEGDPHIKARIRSQQREAARRRMMQAVPTADVVVTNPTHYAVALCYSEQGDGVPKVVAKGSGLIAQRIREIAAEHQVVIMEAPPLARALYFNTELEQDIPPQLYTAVAQVLAYVYQLRSWRDRGGLMPAAPVELEVPAGMDEKKVKDGAAMTIQLSP